MLPRCPLPCNTGLDSGVATEPKAALEGECWGKQRVGVPGVLWSG